MTAYTPTWKIWIQKAHSDLKSAKILLEQPGDEFLENVVYLSQQSAEKSIKGYLTLTKNRFKKTHKIFELLEVLAQSDLVFSELLKPSDALTVYATAFRYPEEGKEPIPLVKTTAISAVKIAEWVFLEIQMRTPK